MSSSQLRLNLASGSVSLSFNPDAARELQAALATLMQSFKVLSSNAGGKPNPQRSLEYRYTGEVFLEMFCNPNIWPTPFAATLLVTLRDERICLITEAELTRVIDDLNQYLEQN